jgi:ABC-type multidrug transport system ATPase subunit
MAVSHLNFGLQAGECFALLGVNGAGKSTTFKMLTNETRPTKGRVLLAGLDMQRDFEIARSLVGYCPQANLLFEEMSVEEHLWYYARIKGIPSEWRAKLIDDAIEQLGLTIHRTKLAGNLSGGNKRKLCVAMAILGGPPIIFLDEPSAGMDPESRRFMWNVVG